MKFRLIFLLLIVFVSVSPIFSATKAGKPNWVNVRSKNFFLVGDANEKDIKKVATRLEQFREVFRQLFSKIKLESPVQTNVVVFNNKKSYEPFLPRQANGKADKWIAGYFQPGEDVNYITLSTEGESDETFRVIFHEYTHFILDTNYGRADVPPWFNEGLAEYYETFAIRDDRIVNLGAVHPEHLQLLQQSKLIPFDQLFAVNYYSLHQNGHDTRNIFYAESWALIHYLLQGNKGVRLPQLGKFLNLLLANKPPKEAFTEAFQTDYATMEKELRDYIGRQQLMMTQVTFKNKLTFETEMQSNPISESEANAYLGDLLYHSNRADDAESYLQKSLAENPNSSLANTAFGLVKTRQRKFDEAERYLEKAVKSEQKNHFAHYQYAYVLSRKEINESGFVSGFAPETAQKMRDSLKTAIALKPDFAESYRLLAFINLVQNEQLDEALGYLRKAQAIQPGNLWYLFDIAQIYFRQQAFAPAAALADKVVNSASDPRMKASAQNLLEAIKRTQAEKTRFEEMQKQAAKDGQLPSLLRRDENGSVTQIEAQSPEEAINDSINQALRKPQADEKRLLGSIEKIECDNKGVTFTIKSETQVIKLLNKEIQGLKLMAYTPEVEGMQIGCGVNLSKVSAVITYKPATEPKSKTNGELIAIEFVSKVFKLKP